MENKIISSNLLLVKINRLSPCETHILIILYVCNELKPGSSAYKMSKPLIKTALTFMSSEKILNGNLLRKNNSLKGYPKNYMPSSQNQIKLN